MTSVAKVRPFSERADAKENAEDFLDDVEFAVEQTERMSITTRIIAMGQGGKGIAAYIGEAEQLFKNVPKDLSEMFALYFIKGLSDPTKKAAVSFAMR
ncbi:hypothetical protein BGX38DRAFT_1270283 [Terfezia claveryi]|nr:hypothetical protein BGX38DRAFT_1270283 [Terfezia claveryi]